MNVITNTPNMSHKPSVFLTIGIQTYNRAKSLKRLLEQLYLLGLDLDIKKVNVEVLVSDNYSSDSTPLVIEEFSDKLVASGYLFSSYRQKKNLGLDGNSLFLLKNARGRYLWFFSDDDILISENFISLIEDIKEFRPGVCLSNFIQHPYTKSRTIFLSKSSEDRKILTQPIDSIKALKKYPKLTNYIIKRDFLLNSAYLEYLDRVVEKCNGQFYLFISFSLLAYFFCGNILIRKASIARCDEDYLAVRYSPQVFQNIDTTVELSLTSLKQDAYIKAVCAKPKAYSSLFSSMRFLALHYEGKATLSSEILTEEENFVKNSSLRLCLHPQCIFLYLKIRLIWFLNKNK